MSDLNALNADNPADVFLLYMHQRDRADAAERRLRVAVEALHELASETAFQHPPEHNRNKAALALFAIGELP